VINGASVYVVCAASCIHVSYDIALCLYVLCQAFVLDAQMLPVSELVSLSC
jgi:hypothetical protein